MAEKLIREGLVIFAFGLPNLLFAMLGGIIADRANRLKLLISTRLYVSVLIFALAILRITDLLEMWHVYAVVSRAERARSHGHSSGPGEAR